MPNNKHTSTLAGALTNVKCLYLVQYVYINVRAGACVGHTTNKRLDTKVEVPELRGFHD